MNTEFKKELSKLDVNGQYPDQEKISLVPLYGPLEIPDSQYIFAWTPWNPKMSKYIMKGSENRETPGDVYKLIGECFEGEGRMLLKQTSSLSSFDIFVGKRLNLPKGLERRPSEGYDDHMRRIIKTLKNERISIDGEMVIDVNAWAGPYNALNAKKVMEGVVLDSLYGNDFEVREMPEIKYSWRAYGPGDANAEVRFFTDDCYVGELKSIQAKLPCGKTFSEAKMDFDREWEGFGEDSVKNSFLNFYASGDPNIGEGPVIECCYKKGWQRCAPDACYNDNGIRFIQYC